MTYTAEQITFMLAEAIEENREYKSWHCSTQHLMALVERVVTEEREACAKIVEEHAKAYAKLEIVDGFVLKMRDSRITVPVVTSGSGRGITTSDGRPITVVVEAIESDEEVAP